MPLQGQRGKDIHDEEYFKRDDLNWLTLFSCENPEQ
jgi:hypothetical protein